MSAGWRCRRRPRPSPAASCRPRRGTQRPVGVALLQRLLMPLVVQKVEHREHQQQCVARAQHQRLPAKHLHPERGRRPAASCAPGPRREQGPLHGGRRSRQLPGKRARGQSSRRTAAHHRHSRGRRRGGGGPAAREGDAAGRLRAPGLGPPIRGGRGGRGGWSPAPRAGSPMAAAPAPRRIWSSGCAPERPRISDRRTVRLALSLVSVRFSLAWGPQAFEGAAGLRYPSPRQSFPAAGALQLRRGNFHRAQNPALHSTERGASRLQRCLPRVSRDRSFPPGSGIQRRLETSVWSSSDTTQHHANPLSIARSESCHPSGGGGEGTARPRSGGCFFYHQEDVRAGGSGEPRRSVAANWPRRTLNTKLKAKERDPPRHRFLLPNEVPRQRKPPPRPH